MAKKKSVTVKLEAQAPEESAIGRAISKGIHDLYLANEAKINAFLECEQERKISVSFGVSIDKSESCPLVEVRISAAQRVKDKRVVRIEDPNQVTFNFVEPDQFEADQLGIGDGKPEGDGSEEGE